MHICFILCKLASETRTNFTILARSNAWVFTLASRKSDLWRLVPYEKTMISWWLSMYDAALFCALHMASVWEKSRSYSTSEVWAPLLRVPRTSTWQLALHRSWSATYGIIITFQQLAVGHCQNLAAKSPFYLVGDRRKHLVWSSCP